MENLEPKPQDAPPDDFTTHPAVFIFPPMPEVDYQALKEDIREHGQRDDICVFKGQILDGRHRYRACRELGIEPQWCELTECDDPVAYVLSKNLHRRHLTQSQRAQCAAEVARLKNGEAGRGREIASQNCLPIDDAAKAFSVSPSSVKTAKHVADKGDASVVNAVKAGEIAVSLAAELVDSFPDKKDQRKILNDARQAVEKGAKGKAKKAIARAMKGETKRKPKPKTSRVSSSSDAPSASSRPSPAVRCFTAFDTVRDILAVGDAKSWQQIERDIGPELACRAHEAEAALFGDVVRSDLPVDVKVQSGERIIRTALHTMVLIGAVEMNGTGEHAAFRLAETATTDSADIFKAIMHELAEALEDLDDSGHPYRAAVKRRIENIIRQLPSSVGDQLWQDFQNTIDRLASRATGEAAASEQQVKENISEPIADDAPAAPEPAVETFDTTQTVAADANTVTVGCQRYEVKRDRGQWHFRVPGSDGWTCASAEMAELIAAQATGGAA